MKLQRAPAAGLRLALPAAWQRCAYDGCALVDDGVELMWQPWQQPAAPAEPPPTATTLGLAFDRLGRALRSVRADGMGTDGHLESLPLAAQADALSLAPPPPWTPLPSPATAGCGAAVADTPAAPSQPAALAAAAPDLLWVADAAAPQVWRYDLWSRRYTGAQPLPAAPVALCAAGGDGVLALLRQADGQGGLALLRDCAPPQLLPWPAALRAPSALALDAQGGLWVLLHAGSAQAEVVSLGPPAHLAAGLRCSVPGARALAIGAALRDSPRAGAPEQRLFVAHVPGRPWQVFTLAGAEDRPVIAPGHDGGAIATQPDGRVAYVATVQGRAELRQAAPTRLARARSGRVLSFRFDSEQPRAPWGRVLLEACIAPNTALAVRCLATDDDTPALDAAPRTPPANQPGLQQDAYSPPLPDVLAMAALHDTAARPCVPRPPSGQRPGLPGWRPARPGHQWLESWAGGEGRFLWVEIELQGDGLRSPVLRALEVEQPGHAWLSQLPRVFSREAQAADFLRRYLAGPAHLLADLGLDADTRHLLLAPDQSPAPMLDWLAALLGLALQPAWPEAARRTLLAEAGRMAPRHGTPEVLRRIVEILAGAPVLLLEDFRLRAPGVIGGPDGNVNGNGSAGTVLGGGLRLGTAKLGDDEPAAVDSGAWRFTLLLLTAADTALLTMLRDAVERFKPAHTAFRLCALDSGLRLGIGLHLDVAALVGPDSGFPLPVLGSTRLGHDAVLGRSGGLNGGQCGGTVGEGAAC